MEWTGFKRTIQRSNKPLMKIMDKEQGINEKVSMKTVKIIMNRHMNTCR
jgi:hypothetical protein